jgi:hypothetical protein
MILQRIGKALRTRDWSTVLLELVIVVVGIYLGLQVDAWDTARQQRAEADYYVQRIAVELDDTLGLLQGSLDSANDLVERSQRAIGAVRGETINDDTRAAFEEDFIALFSVPNFRFAVSSLVELQTTGRLASLSDSDLRRRLTLFHEGSEIRRGQSDMLTDAAAPVVMDLIGEIDLDPNYMSNARILSSDADLNGNTRLLRIMTKIELMQVVHRNNLEGIIGDVQELREALAGL